MKKTINKRFVAALIALIIELITVVGMIGMGLYSLGISGKSFLYTWEISDAYESTRRYATIEYGNAAYNEIYNEVNEKRQDLYDTNDYTRWYFYNISGFGRLGVIVGWFIVPAAIITSEVLDLTYDSHKEKIKKQSNSVRK